MMISPVYNFLSILLVRTYFFYFTISFYKIPTSDHPLNTQYYLNNIFHFLFITILLLILSPLKYLSHLFFFLVKRRFIKTKLRSYSKNRTRPVKKQTIQISLKGFQNVHRRTMKNRNIYTMG